jgi:hypothetical protein
MRALNRNSKTAKRPSALVPALPDGVLTAPPVPARAGTIVAPQITSPTDRISGAESTSPSAAGDTSSAPTIVHEAVPPVASAAPGLTAFPVLESANPEDRSQITSLPLGWTPVRGRTKVARDPSGVIRSLSPDGLDDGTRQAVSDFESALRSDYPAAGAAVLATIKAAARAYGMVTRLSAAVDRAGAVAPNGRLRSAVRSLGEWEDRLAALLRSLPDRPTTPVDPQAALRAAVEAAKR